MYEWLEEYCRQKPGVSTYYKEEWGWQRYLIGGKLFADFFVRFSESGERSLGFVTFPCDPLFGDLLKRQYRAAAPGYYTNKERNVTVWFDPDAVPERDRNAAYGAAPEPEEFPSDDVLRDAIDRAYTLAFSKLTKKVQKEIIAHE